MGNYGLIPAIDPARAETVFEPPGAGEGHWVGAPSVHPHDGATYLAVRWRTPADRGYVVTLYEQVGTTAYEERASITAADLGVVSVERPALTTDPHSGDLQLYLPVDHGENDWTIQKLGDVSRPGLFDPTTARDVLTPQPNSTDAATVKDPYLVTVGGRYYMFYAGHDGRSEQAHLATSVDGTDWTKSPGNPLIPRQHWHDHHTRISCVVPARDCPAWLVFYDGSGRSDYGETWNLRTGLAVSVDLETVVDTTRDEPWLTAPAGPDGAGIERFATCRYVDVLERDGAWEVFFEAARDDGAFELRRLSVALPVDGR